MGELPDAGAGHNEVIRKKIDAAVAARNLARASNNTRWDELLDYVRHQAAWKPSYRVKLVTGEDISAWDTEWFYHLPFPFALVEWLDINLFETVRAKGRLLPPEIIDRTDEISKVVEDIGFEFEVRGNVLRIWGYLPRSHDDFPFP